MNDTAKKKQTIARFYKNVAVAAGDSGWRVLLDGKPMRTPGKVMLETPSETLAKAIAEEWDGQGQKVRLDTMRMTQFTCAALDYTGIFREDAENEAYAYAATDLLCYRADAPPALVERQLEAWNPWVEWAQAHYSISLKLAEGIMPVAQDAAMLGKMQAVITALPVFDLTAVWLLAKHYSSLLLALAVYARKLDAGQAFLISRLEETVQNEQWGEDAEAAERRQNAHAEVVAIGDFLNALREV